MKEKIVLIDDSRHCKSVIDGWNKKRFESAMDKGV